MSDSSRERGRFENLLSPIQVGSVRLKNRMYKPAAGTKLFKDSDGYVTEKGMLLYEAWAKGGVGCVVVESPAIADELSVDTIGKYAINDDKFIPGLRQLADRIRKHDSLAFLQLYHAGQWHLREITGLTPVSSSAHPPISEFASVGDLKTLLKLPPCEALSLEKIEIIEQQFIDAAVRGAKAGFQGADVNAGANHLLASFVSRHWNSRTDQYGCDSFENRTRIVVNIIKGIKKKLGGDFPVMVTMNALENGMEGDGITMEESAEIARIYERAGADALQVRVYEIYNRACYWLEQYFYPERRDPLPPGLDFRHKGVGAFHQVAAATKQAVSIPVMTPGKWDFHLDFAEEMIRKKHVDIVGIVRGLFADCELPNKVAQGRLEDIAPCTACLTCLTGGMFPVRCRINKFLGGEREYFSYPKLTKKKKVLVAGAGPAGLEAARVSALRGHEVILYSKDAFLGGLMNMANIVKGSYPEDVRKIVNYFTVQLKKLNVSVVKGREVTPRIVEAERPDVAILATGALLSSRVLPGGHRKIVVSDHVLRKISNLALRFVSPASLSRLTEFWMPIGTSVVVMGGDIKGLQLAEFLLKRGRKVTIVTDEAPDKWGEGLPNLNNYKLNVWFTQREIEIIRSARYEEITPEGLIITTKEGEERLLEADSIVPVFPLRPDEDLYQTLQGKVPELFTVGACKNPKALIVDAIADASEVASSI